MVTGGIVVLGFGITLGVREGTLLSAVLVGTVVKLLYPLLSKPLEKLLTA